MILADIQTTFNLTLTVLVVSAYFAAYLGFHVLRHLGRTMHKSYEKGGGTPQLGKNIFVRLLGMLLKRLIFKR